MPTVVVVLLLLAATALLVGSWLSGRRGRDPASSVVSFQRAMDAIRDSTPDRHDHRDHQDRATGT